MTERQRELLEFIEGTQGRERRMPSYREMAKALKLSAVGSVQDLVAVLVNKGHLSREGRRLKLAGAREGGAIRVPVLGEVAAGTLHEAWEHALGSLPLPPELLRKGAKTEQFFALRVKGESMIGAGIFEKDYVIVDRNTQPRNGDIVVARINGEATVKELEAPKRKGELPRLLAHNAKFAPIVPTRAEDLEILGRVVSVQRYL